MANRKVENPCTLGDLRMTIFLHFDTLSDSKWISLQVTTPRNTSGLFFKLSELDKNRMLSLVTDICPVHRNAQGRCSILGLHCFKMSYSYLITDYGTILPQTPWNLNATSIFGMWVTSAYFSISRGSDFYLSPVIPLSLENTAPLCMPPALLAAPLVSLVPCCHERTSLCFAYESVIS